MCQNRINILFALIIILLVKTTLAAEPLPIINDTGHVMKLWIYPYTVKNWQLPPENFGPHKRKIVNFNSGEDFYLVFMDEQGRETPIGRYNITNVLQQNPTYEVSIQSCVMCAAEQTVENVWCPRHRTWHEIPSKSINPMEEYKIQWFGR